MYPSLLVFLGGGLGSLLRYLTSIGADRLLPASNPRNFPLGTFLVNICGCFAIGIVMTAFSRDLLKEDHRLFLAVGILGGFTTFSSYTWETLSRAQQGNLGLALLYIALSNTLGLAAAFAAMKLTTALISK